MYLKNTFYCLLIFSAVFECKLLPSVYFKKFLAVSTIGSSLLMNNVNLDYTDEKKITHSTSSYHDSSDLGKTSDMLVERNNIYLYGVIDTSSCQELKDKINQLNFNGKLYRITYNLDPPPINIHVQSYGGSPMDSFYILDLIESSETPVHTYVDGYSASAASLINVVGQKRFMTKNSLMLIHQLYSGSEGKFEELKDENLNMIMLMDKIKSIYLKKTNIPEEKLNEILKHDIWLDAETCKKYGLIDEII